MTKNNNIDGLYTYTPKHYYALKKNNNDSNVFNDGSINDMYNQEQPDDEDVDNPASIFSNPFPIPWAENGWRRVFKMDAGENGCVYQICRKPTHNKNNKQHSASEQPLICAMKVSPVYQPSGILTPHLNETKYHGLLFSSLRESDILARIQHPRIVKCYESYCQNGYMFHKMEMAQDNVQNWIHQHWENASVSTLCTIAYQMIEAVAVLHNCHIMHRDLKPSNFLINYHDSSNNNNYSNVSSPPILISLCDFGWSCYWEPNTPFNTEVQASWWRAPEVIAGYAQYSLAIDVWSMGVVLMGLMFGNIMLKTREPDDILKEWIQYLGPPTPFVSWIEKYAASKSKYWISSISLNIQQSNNKTLNNDLVTEIQDKIWTPKWYLYYHQKLHGKLNTQKLAQKWTSLEQFAACLDLLRHMLEWDPEKRYTANECLNHHFFTRFVTPSIKKIPISPTIHIPSQRIASTLLVLRSCSSDVGFKYCSQCLTDVVVVLLTRLRFKQNQVSKTNLVLSQYWDDKTIARIILKIIFDAKWFQHITNTTNNSLYTNNDPNTNKIGLWIQSLLHEECQFLQSCFKNLQRIIEYVQNWYNQYHMNDIHWNSIQDLSFSIASRLLLVQSTNPRLQTLLHDISACVIISLKLHPTNDRYVSRLRVNWVLPPSCTEHDLESVRKAEERMLQQLHHQLLPKPWLMQNAETMKNKQS